jgi:hypothetical protein
MVRLHPAELPGTPTSVEDSHLQKLSEDYYSYGFIFVCPVLMADISMVFDNSCFLTASERLEKMA